jgi:quercetin dioxygenase-like cupin family protein
MSERREFLQTLLAAALTSGAAAQAADAAQNAGTAQAAGATQPASAAQPARASRLIQRQLLSGPFEGLDATFVEVVIPPGVESRRHKHSGFVLGYVIEGEFRFGTNDEPPRVVRAGESFYEPPGATHTMSASARPDQPVKLLAIIIGPKGAEITTYER